VIAIEGVTIDVVAPPQVAIEGVPWAKDGAKCFCRINGCDALYIAKYNLVQCLQTCHNVTMELGKPKHPFIHKQGPKVLQHATMNAWVLSNPLAQFCHNKQKAIARTRKHTTLKFDKLQGDLQYTFEVPKSTFVKLASSHILQLLHMIAWGVGAMFFNIQAKLEHDEHLALVI
jgi:hypothetical protein